MDFHVLTLFPDMVRQGLNTSIIGRAMKEGHITLNTVNIRDFSINKHNRVDDYPYGGGAGMVMQPGPVYRAYEAVKEQIEQRKKSQCAVSDENEPVEDTTADKGRQLRVVYMTPQGKELTRLTKKSAVTYLYIGRPISAATQPQNDSACVQMNDKLITPSEISDYMSAEKKRMSPEDLQAMVVSRKAESSI